MMRRFNYEGKSKFKNEKCFYKGEEFDSKLEMARYIYLMDAESKGAIENLRRQVKYVLIPKQTYIEEQRLKTKTKFVEKTLFKEIIYKADFVYEIDGKTYIEDVKGSKYIITPEFKLKQKLMYYVHHIFVNTIFSATADLP